MIELARHIEILLLDNDCVIVPGLGGFVTHHIPARRVENEGRFMPPYRTLGFSPKMVLNDGLLVQSYMQAYDTNYPTAMRLVEQKVEELKDLLSKNGVFKLHGIGTLRQNIKGEFNFTPLEAGLLSPSLYGFSSFEMKTLDELRAENANQEKSANNTLQPIEKENGEETPNRSIIISMDRRWISGIAAACIGLLVVLAVSFSSPNADTKLAISFKPLIELFNKASKQETVAKMDVEAAKPAVKKAVKKAPVAVAPQETATEKAEEPKPEAVVAPQESNYFTIVLASSIPVKNAERYAQQMADKGYGDAKVLSTKNLNRVVYAQFSSENQAINRLRELRQECKDFAQAWVLEVK